MSDFRFIGSSFFKVKKWVILAPRRAKRPDVAKGVEPVCPFCPGKEGNEQEVYRVSPNDNNSDWLVRVLPNKFPFAPIHEVIIHSPDHHKNYGELPLEHVVLLLQTYRHLFQTHQNKGQIYIFHNRGREGGESLPHPHTQLAVVPFDVELDTPRLDGSHQQSASSNQQSEVSNEKLVVSTEHFDIFCPLASQWPDEVWVAPKKRGCVFGEITDDEVSDLAHVLTRLIQILDLRHGREFPYNFYIYPGGDWYLRLIPRKKTLGGFEVGTGIFVNTQDPQETLVFLKTHFYEPDEEKIKLEHQAEYHKTV